MKLVPNREAITVIEVGLLSIRQLTQGIRKTMGANVRAEKDRQRDKKSRQLNIADRIQKKSKERLIELKQTSFIKKPLSGALQGTGSFFGGLLRAAGWLLLGYLTQKLPEIIDFATRIKTAIETIFTEVSKIWTSITNVLNEASDLLSQLKENIFTGDFLDSEGKLQKEFGEFTDTLDTEKNNMGKSFGNIVQELKKLQIFGQRETNKKRRREGEEPIDFGPESQMSLLNRRDYMGRKRTLDQKLSLGEINQERYDMEMEVLNELLAAYIANGNQPVNMVAPAQEPAEQIPPTTETNITPNQVIEVPEESGITLVPLEPQVQPQSAVIPSSNIVGRVGSTGKSTGPHIHIEVGDGFGGRGQVVPQNVLDNIMVDGKPLSTYTVTSPMGYRNDPVYGGRQFHGGIDFGIRDGAAITLQGGLKLDTSATGTNGTGYDEGWNDGYGNSIVIKDASGRQYLIGHLLSGPEKAKKGGKGKGGPDKLSLGKISPAAPPISSTIAGMPVPNNDVVVHFPVDTLNILSVSKSGGDSQNITVPNSSGSRMVKSFTETVQRYNRNFT